jgi:hypothetical protein
MKNKQKEWHHATKPLGEVQVILDKCCIFAWHSKIWRIFSVSHCPGKLYGALWVSR